MRISELSRYVLGVCAIAMFAGCGGGNPPFSPSPAEVTAQRTHARPAYAVLYSFKGKPDGERPFAGLLNVKGTLYGTTFRGGANDLGTVFAITTPGAESVVYSFDTTSGLFPAAGLINVKGALYGTTVFGPNGFGTVFSITTSGKETVLHSFDGPRSGDGADPYAGLLNVNGTLYGTTTAGGAGCVSSYGCGTVFAITPSGNETVLHSFGTSSGDGEEPEAGLINVNATLYGTTESGGANGDGTVFSVTPSGTETVLHSFGGAGDGDYPSTGLLNVNGTLYGTTAGGGTSGAGSVFAITPSGTETVLYSFGGSGDGVGPKAGLINVKGTLYGTTFEGGAKNHGTVFSVTTSGTETVLYSFKGGSGDGENPYVGLIKVNGTLYGTTAGGGSGNCKRGCGTVFSLSP